MATGGKRDPVTHRTPAQEKARTTPEAYAKYNGKPEQIAKRSMRNKARAALMKEGLVKKGDGKDVEHIKPIRAGGTNARSNLKVRSRSANRGWTDDGK